MHDYQLGLYEKSMPADLGWEERLTYAKKSGFDYLEISIDETDLRLSRLDWNAQERNALASACRNAGVPIGSMCLSGHRKYPLGSSDPAVRARGMQIMEKALRFSCDLGIHIIQLAGYDVYYEESTPETVRLFAENLVSAAELAAAYGVALGFETMETPFMDTVEKSMVYIHEVRSPYLGVYPDLGNLTNASLLYGVTVADDLACGTGHLFAAHIKETRPGHYRDVPFCSGHVDFPAALGCCWRLGVRRYVTELWDQGTGTWQADIRQASTLARGILNSLKQED